MAGLLLACRFPSNTPFCPSFTTVIGLVKVDVGAFGIPMRSRSPHVRLAAAAAIAVKCAAIARLKSKPRT